MTFPHCSSLLQTRVQNSKYWAPFKFVSKKSYCAARTKWKLDLFLHCVDFGKYTQESLYLIENFENSTSKLLNHCDLFDTLKALLGRLAHSNVIGS